MLDRKAQEEITRAVQMRWSERCEAGEMAAYIARAERGHSLANHVQDVTVQTLKSLYPGRIAFQGSGAKRKKRRMGEVWTSYSSNSSRPIAQR